MEPKPLYTANNLCPAYHLRYGWTAWPSAEPFPPAPPNGVIDGLSSTWKADSIHLLEHKWRPDCIRMVFSTAPTVSPAFLTARAKGRLQHALRQAGNPVKFSRKLAVRSIGENRRADVEGYIRTQLNREHLADSRFEERLRSHAVSDASVDLAAPTETGSGCYWYNLHLVLVVAGRYRMGEEDKLGQISRGCRGIAEKEGYGISELSVMPDHLHAALRGNVEHSPQEIALAFQNNLAYLLGQYRVWDDTYYVGTFGEYDMGAVRR